MEAKQEKDKIHTPVSNTSSINRRGENKETQGEKTKGDQNIAIAHEKGSQQNEHDYT